jgi:inhibitor of KinA sporulation pathway (predicted exonuclease)
LEKVGAMRCPIWYAVHQSQIWKSNVYGANIACTRPLIISNVIFERSKRPSLAALASIVCTGTYKRTMFRSRGMTRMVPDAWVTVPRRRISANAFKSARRVRVAYILYGAVKLTKVANGNHINHTPRGDNLAQSLTTQEI